MAETNDWNITVNDVLKVNTEAGDTLLITLPEQTSVMPRDALTKLSLDVVKMFDRTFADKKVRVLVIPYGMDVQLIKSSQLEDK